MSDTFDPKKDSTSVFIGFLSGHDLSTEEGLREAQAELDACQDMVDLVQAYIKDHYPNAEEAKEEEGGGCHV